MARKTTVRIALIAALALAASLFAAHRQTGAAVGAVDQPGACPLRFDAHTVGLPKTCLFVGRYNGSCGKSALAIFAGNGDTLVIGVAFSQAGDTTYLAGDVESRTSAQLAVWQKSLHVLAASSVSGSVTLEEDGELLRVRMADSPFEIDGCRFDEFVGRFVEMVDAGENVPRSVAPPRAPGGGPA
jgi:hypothetical protein